MDALCSNSIDLIHYAKNLAVRNINFVEIMTNYVLGKWIVEEQQNGSDRAKYGSQVINKLSEALIQEFGRGFLRESLRNSRKFFMVYGNSPLKKPNLIGKFVNDNSDH